MPKNIDHPFMRGIMNFDDYNYNSYNKYILTHEPGHSERRRIINERKKLLSSERVENINAERKSTLSYEDLL